MMIAGAGAGAEQAVHQHIFGALVGTAAACQSAAQQWGCHCSYSSPEPGSAGQASANQCRLGRRQRVEQTQQKLGSIPDIILFAGFYHLIAASPRGSHCHA